jgi:transcriptional regulator with XRE-family HTH domain
MRGKLGGDWSVRTEKNAAEISKRLRWLREAQDFNQAAIARQINVQRTRWNNWETAVGCIPVDVATLLVQKFGVTLDWIYMGREAGMPYELMLKIRRMSEKETRED